MISKLIIALYVLATASALVVMKLGSSNGAPVAIENSKLALNLNPLFITGAILYIVSFVLYTYLISKYDLGYIIPLGTAIVYVLIFIASFIIFKESFTIPKIIGITLICIGVGLLNINK